METMKEILGAIGAIASIAAPIIWGAYFWHYRHQFRSKRNQ